MLTQRKGVGHDSCLNLLAAEKWKNRLLAVVAGAVHVVPCHMYGTQMLEGCDEVTGIDGPVMQAFSWI